MKISMIFGVLLYFLTLLSFRDGSSSAFNILYNVTVVRLRTNITELTAVAQADSVQFFQYPATTMEKKLENDLSKSGVQHVNGHWEDLDTFLSPIMKDFNQTEGFLQWLIECDGINVSLTTAHMKYISGSYFITFHLKNESWTLSDDQATVIMRSLDPEYAQNAKTILQEECKYWANHAPATAIPPGNISRVTELGREQSDGNTGTSKNETNAGSPVSGVLGGVLGVLGGVLGCAVIVLIVISCYKKKNSSEPTPGARWAQNFIYKVIPMCDQLPRRAFGTEGYNCV